MRCGEVRVGAHIGMQRIITVLDIIFHYISNWDLILPFLLNDWALGNREIIRILVIPISPLITLLLS